MFLKHNLHSISLAGTHSQCCNEAKALQEHFATLVEAVNHIDSFGSQLVQNRFLSQKQLSDILGTLGVPNSKKICDLLLTVSTKIKTAKTKETAQEYFNKLVYILAHNLELEDQAKVLVTKLRKCGYILYHNNIIFDIFHSCSPCYSDTFYIWVVHALIYIHNV